jgi:hypothetical protein
MWDKMDEWKAENEQFRQKIPEIMKRIEEMGKELKQENRK